MSIKYKFLDKNITSTIYENNDFCTLIILFDKVFIDRFDSKNSDRYAVVGYQFQGNVAKPFVIPEEFLNGFSPIGFYSTEIYDKNRRLIKCVRKDLNFYNIVAYIYDNLEILKFKIIPFIKYIYSKGEYTNQIHVFYKNEKIENQILDYVMPGLTNISADKL